MGRKKGMVNAGIMFAVFGLTLWIVFRGQDMGVVVDHIQTADMRYWALAVASVLLFIAGEAVNISYMLRAIRQRVAFARCLLYSFVGFFFNCVTPSGTGGQPAQVYYMRKGGIPTPIAAQILLIITITYKMVLVVIGLAVLLIRPPSVMEYLEPVMGLCYLGLFLNALTVLFIYLLIFHPTMARHIVVALVAFLGKLRIVRRPGRMIDKIDGAMAQYRDAAAFFRANRAVVWNVFLITVVQRFLLFNVTYLAVLSFGLAEAGFVRVLLLQGMIAVAVDMLPFPGGMGISEKMILMVFAPLCGVYTLPVMIVARALSSYTQLILSALMTVVAHFAIARQRGDQEPVE